MNRPPLIIANSSWYLTHYRKLLITEVYKSYSHVVTLSPIDKTSKDLSECSLFIPWNIDRGKSKGLISFMKSGLKLIFLIRGIKPRFIHSHTLLSNLLVSFVASLFSIPNVLSFPGLGKLYSNQGLSSKILIVVFKLIILFSSISRNSRFLFKKSFNRTIFIFQNKNDLNFFKSKLKEYNHISIELIYGSGLPSHYLDNKTLKNKNCWQLQNKINIKPNFVYCARLLKSKGILLFIEMAKLLPEYKFTVYGNIDSASPDSLTHYEIKKISKQNPNIVFFSNQKDPLIKCKDNFSILMVPSNYGEGFPRAIAEGIALNYPVIISEKASCKIFDDNDVYIAKSHNVESYIQQYKLILKDFLSGELQEKMKKARNKVINNFTEEIVVNKTLEIYKKLVWLNEKTYFEKRDSKNYSNWISL